MVKVDFSDVPDLDPITEKFKPFTEPTEDWLKRQPPDRQWTDEKGKLRFNHGTHDSWIKIITWSAMQYGMIIGVLRQTQSRILNLTDKLRGVMRSPEKKHCTEAEGACAEIAVASFMGVKWDGLVQKFKKGGDVGNWTQVRHSLRMTKGLHIRPNDEISKNKPYVHVTGCMTHYLIHGWEWGFKALQRDQSYQDSDSPAWVVPYSELRSMDDIPPEPKYEVGEEVTDSELKKIMGWSDLDFQKILDE